MSTVDTFTPPDRVDAPDSSHVRSIPQSGSGNDEKIFNSRKDDVPPREEGDLELGSAPLNKGRSDSDPRRKRKAIFVKNIEGHNDQLRIKQFNFTRAQTSISRKLELDEKQMKLDEKKKANDPNQNFNFVVGSGDAAKRFRFEDNSLMLFDRKSKFRQAFVRVMAHPWFENFILFMIMVNAIFFSMADYTKVDEDGNIVEEGSIRNMIIIRTNIVFLVVFTLEFVVKVIAMGFVGNNGAYLTDSWNKLDFIVVVTSILVAAVPNLPSISSLRLIRILRPLRSLTMLPGLRDIVKSIFASLPELAGVIVLMSFVFLVFAIAGLELFGGASTHARCRATPYPVNTSYQFSVHGTNYAPFRCIPDTNLDTITDDVSLGKSTSPWATKRDCYWPLHEAETEYAGLDFSRTCSLEGTGMNTCFADNDALDESLWSWCGSNFDAYGNRRFRDDDKFGTSNPTGKKIYRNGKYIMNDRDMFTPDLNYGFTNFDSFGPAIVTIFQVITEEGWTHILYMNMDSYGKTTASIYFTLIILMGCFFVLQLLLAVLEDNFHSAKEEVKRLEAEARAAVAALEQEEKAKERKKEMVIMTSDKLLGVLAKKRMNKEGSGDQARRISSMALRRWSTKKTLASSGLESLVDDSQERVQSLGEEEDSGVQQGSMTTDPGSGTTAAATEGMAGEGDKDAVRDPQPTGSASAATKVEAEPTAEKRGGSSFVGRLSGMFRRASYFQSPQEKEQRRKSDAAKKLINLVHERSIEEVSRLPHITAEELFGDTLVSWAEEGVLNVKDFLKGARGWVSARVRKLSEEKVDLAEGPSENTFRATVVLYATLLVEWQYFEVCSGVFIMINCVTLMADHYPMDTEVASGLDISNAILTIIFTLEMAVILIAKGPTAYTKDALSTFDAFVVIASLIDLCLAPPSAFGDTGVDISRISALTSVISMMRCFRLFRMIKLAIRIKSLKTLFFRVAKTFIDLSSYMILLMVIILIYTVAGLQFFANTFRFDVNGEPITEIYSEAWLNAYEVARYNFDDFSSSFGSVFQVITTENWNDIMYSVWRVYGPFGIIFPMSLVLGGTFILMNLFLGILLSNFKGTGEEISHEETEDENTNEQIDSTEGSTEDHLTPLNSSSLRSPAALTPGSTRSDSLFGSEMSDGESAKSQASPSRKMSKQRSVEDERLADYIEARKAKVMKALLRRKSLSGGLSSQPTPNRQSFNTPSSSSKVTPFPTRIESDSSDKGEVEDNENQGSSANSSGYFGSIGQSINGLLGSLSPAASSSKVTPLPQEDPVGDEEAGVSPSKSMALVAAGAEASVADSEGSHRTSMVHQSDLGDLDGLHDLDLEEEGVFPLLEVNTLGLFGPTNSFRVICGHILDHKWFETVIQVLILLSSVSLAVDSPLDDPNSDFRSGLVYFEYFTTTIFTIEALLKIIVFGFVFHEGSYLRSGWNVLDFGIVVISLMTMFEAADSLKALKSIRSLRALRPLRVISRAPGLRTIVNAVFDSIPDVINVLSVVLVCFSIFAVVSVNFLKGDLRHCAGDHFDASISSDAGAMSLLESPLPWMSMSSEQRAYFGPSSPVANFSTAACSAWSSGASCCLSQFPDNYAEPITSKMMCKCWGGDWDPVAYITFDNYPAALMGFFMISTTEGWVDLMYAAVDANGIDMQPLRNVNLGYIYFFVLFIICGNFFALNLFVGVMIDNFEKTKFAMQGDLIFMTKEQQEWTKAVTVINHIKPYVHPMEPKDRIGRWCFRICESHEFEVGIIFCIFINTVILGVGYFGSSDTLRYVFENFNAGFAYLFTLEMIIKLVGLRWVYFHSVWNQFDFAVTVGSDVGIMYFLITGERGAMAVMIVRIFRVLRVVRLMEGLETAKKLLDTLLLTLPGILNISLLLMLILFIYAVLGMQLFAKTQFNGSYSTHSNFRTFDNSLMTLVRFATGEGWGDFMYDASTQLDGCVKDPQYDDGMCGFNDKPGCEDLNGCGNIAIFPFLLSFTLFVSMVLFNLFVGVIIEGFQAANDTTKSLRNEDYVKYCETWARFDAEATCLMSIANFEEFLAVLPPPLGLAEDHPTHTETVKYAKKLELSLYSIRGESRYVYFKEALFALMTRAIEVRKDVDLQDFKKDKINEDDDTTRDRALSKPHIEKVHNLRGTVHFTLAEHYAALQLQRAYKKYFSSSGDEDRFYGVVKSALESAKTAKAGDEHAGENDEGKRDFSHDSNSMPPPISKHNSVDGDSEHSGSPVNREPPA